MGKLGEGKVKERLGFFKERMEGGSIKLPAKDGNPDWAFMENYIKSLSYSSNL